MVWLGPTSHPIVLYEIHEAYEATQSLADTRASKFQPMLKGNPIRCVEVCCAPSTRESDTPPARSQGSNTWLCVTRMQYNYKVIYFLGGQRLRGRLEFRVTDLSFATFVFTWPTYVVVKITLWRRASGDMVPVSLPCVQMTGRGNGASRGCDRREVTMVVAELGLSLARGPHSLAMASLPHMSF